MLVLRRSARSRRATPTCRSCTAPTARSSPSGTARPRCRSSARRASCPRRCGTTWRCSAGGPVTTRRSSAPRSSSSASRSTASAGRRRSSTRQKLRWLNGRYMRELPFERYEAGSGRPPRPQRPRGRRGLRGGDARGSRRGLRDRPREGADGDRGLAADRVPLHRARADDEKAWRKVMKPEVAPVLAKERETIAAVEPFDAATLESELRAVIDAEGFGAGKGLQPIRVAITGSNDLAGHLRFDRCTGPGPRPGAARSGDRPARRGARGGFRRPGLRIGAPICRSGRGETVQGRPAEVAGLIPSHAYSRRTEAKPLPRRRRRAREDSAWRRPSTPSTRCRPCSRRRPASPS